MESAPKLASEQSSAFNTTAKDGSDVSLSVTQAIPLIPPSTGSSNDSFEQVSYTLNKWRFPGVVGLILYNLPAGMSWTWFSSIAVQVTKDFHISVSQVNWLGNIINLVFLPASLATPFLCNKYGLRQCCWGGALLLTLSGWIRVAGTAKTLSSGAAYALLVISQVLVAMAQPLFLVSGPRFSEAWFDFNGRTTATMIISISNPLGSALGQLLPSLLGSTRQSILILAIISTAVFPSALLIRNSPPTPPTFAGGITPPNPISTVKSVIGYSSPADRRLSLRARFDFWVLAFAFSVLAGALTAFGLLTAQVFQPYGYSETDSGLFGAAAFLAGLAAAIITAPLFDRVLTSKINLSLKVMGVLLGFAWLGLIWDVRANNAGGIYAVMAVIGILSLALLPIGLELACELIQDAEVSAAILWDGAWVLAIIFVQVSAALTAGAEASPPFNMKKALIFIGALCCFAGCLIVVCFRGIPDSRRAMDKAKERVALQNP